MGIIVHCCIEYLMSIIVFHSKIRNIELTRNIELNASLGTKSLVGISQPDSEKTAHSHALENPFPAATSH